MKMPGGCHGPPYGMDASPMMSGGGDLHAAWERQIISPSKYITIASMNVNSLSAPLDLRHVMNFNSGSQ